MCVLGRREERGKQRGRMDVSTRGFALLDNLARHPEFIPGETPAGRDREGLQPQLRRR